MGVYHITYTPNLKEICLYFNGGCNFSCHGCITDHHPQDCHLEKSIRAPEHKSASIFIDKVISYLEPLSFKKVIFLGKEPTQDADFLALAKILKEKLSTYNILLTNGYRFVEDRAIDEICVSIKAISKNIFSDFTGKNNIEYVLENFVKYTSIPNLKVRAESVFIPGYIDKEEIEKIAQFIAGVSVEIPYRIDGYIPIKEKDRFRRPTKDEMEEAKKAIEKYLKNVSILHYGVRVKYKVKRIY